jgi:hypothetical protein
MRGTLIVLVLAALTAAAGCEYDVFQLRLQPQGDRLERRIVAWRVGRASDATPAPEGSSIGSVSEAARERILAAYGERIEADHAKKLAMRGSFGPAMPDDVGGAGLYLRWPTTLGQAVS